MNKKKILKIGLSLLIAMAFLMPASSVIASTGQPEAGDVTSTNVSPELKEFKTNGAPIAQAPTLLPGDMKVKNSNDDVINLATQPVIPVDTYNFLGGVIPSDDMSLQSGLSLYKVTEGTQNVMYQTSFEDNFDIYSNWVQIDDDCGYNGYYDSFSWSDARSSDGDHSMKSTMYDTYKGNQDDYLLCTRHFDMTGQYAFNVSFDVWVEGQDEDTWMPPNLFYDYLSFEINDGSGWFNPFYIIDRGYTTYLDFFFTDTTLPTYVHRFHWDIRWFVTDMGNGWWHVWYQMPTAYLTDPTDVQFRFDWHTDPQFQYEGAYVDNFKVISIEDVQTKIFQTFTQECTDVVAPTDEVAFPLAWTFEPGDYMIKYWAETAYCEGAEYSTFPKGCDDIIHFSVKDNYDCAIDDITVENSFTHAVIPDEGQMPEGSDAHIMATYHQYGNLPGNDIPVKCTVQKKSWDTTFSWDCENAMPITESYGNVGITDFTSYSGSKSLGFMNEVNKRYANGEFAYAIFGPKIDFEHSMDVTMDYYYRALTGPGDYGYVVLLDPYSNTITGYSYFNFYGHLDQTMQGYNPTWMGPMQPMGRYTTIDLKAIYDLYKSYGYYRDDHGDLMDGVQVGFIFADNIDTGVPDGINYNVRADGEGYVESGIWIDDITIKTLTLGDTVFTDTLVIPGPVEPCETVPIQFEWEDVPYSYYYISVESQCADDVDNTNNEQHQQILVTSDLERADNKNVEAIDYSGSGEGTWGRCGSDYDWYLSSNPDSESYPTWANSVAQLCPAGDGCIDTGGAANVHVAFDAWYDIEVWDSCWLEISNVCTDPVETDWFPVAVFYGSSVNPSNDDWVPVDVDLTSFITGTTFALRFRLESDMGTEFRGMLVDNLEINDGAGGIIFGPDSMDTMDNWCFSNLHFGQYWTGSGPWCANNIPSYPLQDAIIWSTEIADAYAAWLTVDADYDLWETVDVNPWGLGLTYYLAYVAYLEISSDGGANWFILDEFNGTDSGINTYDVTPWTGNDILVRVRLAFEGSVTPNYIADLYGITPEYYMEYNYGVFDAGDICINDMMITGKKDTTPPTTAITMTGTMSDSGWYSTPVQVKITATDDAAMGEIHYILDGSETVVAGNTATFTVSANGAHNLEYWGVDKVGNVEEHHTVPTFKIDSGSPPTVAITAPEPGLYLFGNKLMTSSKVIIIGAFTIEATANDAESGVYRVQFYLDNDIISEDTEAPYSTYCAAKHMGAGTIKVVAEDFSGNTAQDTLDITYYKFL